VSTTDLRQMIIIDDCVQCLCFLFFVRVRDDTPAEHRWLCQTVNNKRKDDNVLRFSFHVLNDQSSV